MKPILVGSSDYKEIIEAKNFYVDKTLLIKEISDANAKVILFPRPRRFGKTLNLSMLRRFYEKSPENYQHLFESMAIWKEEKYQKEQGQWPVISITFKDVKDESWEAAYKTLVEIISEEFKRHKNILANNNIDKLDREQFQSIMDQSANETTYGSSFKFLTRLFSEVYNKKAIVLIDEYDAPIQIAYLHGFYNKMISFMRKLLSSVLKDNDFLERGILTGIMRVAKESIFSGLNNLSVFTMFNNRFETAFGFTQEEVTKALHDYNLEDYQDAAKEWYNGYQSGNFTVYNPWSITHFIKEHGKLETYWLNTSDNALIKQEVSSCSETVYAALQSLLENQHNNNQIEQPETNQVKHVIDDSITMTNLGLTGSAGRELKEHAVWNLLFYSGYITYSLIQETEEEKKIRDAKKRKGETVEENYVLKIPNFEIRKLYKDLITENVKQAAPGSTMDELREALQHGDGIAFETKLTNFVMRSMSSHDLYLNECERNLHLFVLGILVLFEKEYAVRSNRETGKGRYDIMLMPRIAGYAGWIIELKKVYPEKKETLASVVDVALEQIKTKKYTEDLRDYGVQNIVAVGVAVLGKELMVKHEVLEKA